MIDLQYLVALASFPKFGSQGLRKLLRHFPDAETAFLAPPEQLMAAGLSEAITLDFVTTRRNIDPQAYWKKIEQEQIKIITLKDPIYPKLLAKIYDPPAVIFYQGNFPPDSAFCFGVVGSRLMSSYGKQVTEEITTELAASGLIIVSGLALGVDGAAHEAALAAHGQTVAVLGSGVDRASVYPSRHRHLARQIIEAGGAILSEYSPGTIPLTYHFPARNRIIAGLVSGLLVVEAKEGSGALITAQFALDEGREVFAIPGPINQDTSFGPNLLIKNGAHPVTSATDIFEVFDLKIARVKSTPQLNENESRIYAALTREPQHIDTLTANLKLDIAKISSTLALMEMRGVIKNVGGMHFVRNN